MKRKNLTILLAMAAVSATLVGGCGKKEEVVVSTEETTVEATTEVTTEEETEVVTEEEETTEEETVEATVVEECEEETTEVAVEETKKPAETPVVKETPDSTKKSTETTATNTSTNKPAGIIRDENGNDITAKVAGDARYSNIDFNDPDSGAYICSIEDASGNVTHFYEGSDTWEDDAYVPEGYDPEDWGSKASADSPYWLYDDGGDYIDIFTDGEFIFD